MLRKPLALMLAVATVLSLTHTSASAGGKYTPTSKPLLVVIGDSISSPSSVPHAKGGYRYNDKTGDRLQAWWSVMRDQTGHRVRVFAEGGSGWATPGRGCRLTTFWQRVERPAVKKQLARADVIAILGGVNDMKSCDAVQLEEGIERVLASVKATAPKATIVIGAPWGPHVARKPHKARTIRALKAAAARHGVTYVSLNLRRSKTRDKVHPNRQGSELIAKKVRRAVENTKVATSKRR